MTRFLKREWDNTDVSPDALLRARNRAWQRLHGPPPAPLRGWTPLRVGSSAAAAAALVLLALMQWPSRDAVALPVSPMAELPLLSRGLPAPALVLPPPAPGDPAPIAPAPAIEVPERVVVQMRLPESGTRMIWIKTRNFDISGGLK